MNITTILWLVIAGFVIIFGGIMAVLAWNTRKQKVDIEKMGAAEWMARKQTNKKEHPRLVQFYQKSYVRSTQLPIFKWQVIRIRRRLSVVHPYNEYALRKETMRITYITLIITAALILAFAILGKSLLMVMLGIIGCIVLNGMMIDVFVHRIERQLLGDFKNFLEDNRHQYQANKMVDESIYQAQKTTSHNMKLHADRIYRVLMHRNPDKALVAYYDIAPNRYMKVFTGIAHMIREYGDKKTEKGSVYLGAIAKFTTDINYDILRQDKLARQLNSLTLIALAPILLSFPIQSWAEKFFPTMAQFYSGRLGYISQILMFTISVVAYLLIRKLAETEESKYIPKPTKKRWEKRIYEIPVIRQIVELFMPGRHTKKYYQTSQLIKDSNSPLIVEWLTLQRLIIGFSAAILTIALCIGLHINQSHQILYAPSYEGGMMLGKASPEEEALAANKTKLDRQIMQDLSGSKEQMREQIRMAMEQANVGEKSAVDINNDVNRILNKKLTIQGEYFKWYELIIAIAVGVMAYYSPIWMMLFQRKMRRIDMQSEVEQFRMLISILSHFDRMDVRTILVWLERFSTLFKPALQRCLSEYDSGAEFAMRRLKEDAPFPEFVRIIERLENSIARITIKEAFDDLESEQEFHREQKKEMLERIIQSKSTMGRDIGFFPVTFLLGAYIMVPFLYTSFMQMKDLIVQLGQI